MIVARLFARSLTRPQEATMHRRTTPALISLLFGLALCMAARAGASRADLAGQVRATETAFARSMAERDLAAFSRFLAPDAVFVDTPVARGPKAIIAAWREYFTAVTAPFSWAPSEVEVLDSGHLALTSGPVLDPAGKRIGTFTSVWRRERDGRWLIVLDHGCPRCGCP
jgi:ketosteroid isomerase-like protein